MRNVLEWLEGQASLRPDKLAVVDPDSQLSYAELLDRSRRAGSWLVAQGMAPRQALALYLEKSTDALCCMLGGVYAGGFYSVLDVRQPDGRIQAICRALEPALVLTDRANEEAARRALEGTGTRVALVDEALAFPRADADALASVRASAIDVDPLYVNFTSGSTGTPKGVVVSHRSVIDFIPTFTQTFGIDAEDVLGNQAPFDFDVSVKDIYSSLCRGATLRIIPRPYFSNPTTLMDYLSDGQVTTLVWAVSALCFVSIMHGFDYRVPRTVRRVLFSGEVMPPKQLRVWRSFLPGARFVNLYGPTEITCNCTYFEVERDYQDDEVIPMGRAFPNERVFLLDEDGGEVTSPGVEGEVCVGGTALGLGYLGDGEKTAAAFVQSPLNRRWLEPVYRTGDLACYDERGDLVYASRKDHQIKHLGQRIELGDIEAAAQAVEGVERACCVYDARRKRIRLFYLGAPTEDELLDALGKRLPPYMVPRQVRRLDQMPLTKNGKIDRAELAQMGARR